MTSPFRDPLVPAWAEKEVGLSAVLLGPVSVPLRWSGRAAETSEGPSQAALR